MKPAAFVSAEGETRGVAPGGSEMGSAVAAQVGLAAVVGLGAADLRLLLLGALRHRS